MPTFSLTQAQLVPSGFTVNKVSKNPHNASLTKNTCLIYFFCVSVSEPGGALG